MKVAVGHSEDLDSVDAIEEVLDACAEQFGSVIPQAGVLFSAISHDHQALLDGMMNRYPDLELIGATTDGEISSAIGFAEDSVTLMLFQSDKISFAAGIGRNVKDDPGRSARDAVAMASGKLAESSSLCITMPDGLMSLAPELIEGMAEELGPGIPICGGYAGGDLASVETYQFFGNEVLSGAVPVLLFSGPLSISNAFGCGWKPIGAKHRVTDADGTIVKTIDGKPAVELYELYVGGFTANHPFIVFPDDSGNSFISAPPWELEDGSVSFTTRIPTGTLVQMSDASRDDALEGAKDATLAAVSAYPGPKPEAGLIFSCASRRMTLGTRVVEEFELLREHLGDDIPVCGFYTFGELCPLPGRTEPQGHNCTFVTVLIGED